MSEGEVGARAGKLASTPAAASPLRNARRSIFPPGLQRSIEISSSVQVVYCIPFVNQSRTDLVFSSVSLPGKVARDAILPSSGAGVELEWGPVKRLAVCAGFEKTQFGSAQSGFGSLALF